MLQRRLFLQTSGKSLVLLTMAMCLNGFQWLPKIQIAAPSPRIICVVALDTTSMPKEHFHTMRDQFIPELVLRRLKGRDELHILRIDSDPEDGVTVLPIRTQNVGFTEAMAKIYTQHIHSLEHAHVGTTNIAGVLAYAARIARVAQTTEGDKARVMVLLFTDGKPTGQQNAIEGPWPDVPVWFFGVERQHKATLTHWVKDTLALPAEQVEIAQYSDFQSMASLFAHKTGRNFVDDRVLKRIRALP